MSADAWAASVALGKLLGHASPATTQRYAHLADAPLKAAVSKLR